MKKKQHITRILIYIVLLSGAVVMVFPFIWSVLTSFKNLSESLQFPPRFLPQSWSPVNYKDVWEQLPFVDFFINTVLMVLLRIVFAVLFSSMAAYAFARMQFPLKNLLFILVLMPMMVPAQIFVLPQYLFASKIQITNTVMALVLPGLASTFGIFLLRQFFMGVPDELEEAAILDGCNPGQIFVKIMLPLVKPGIVSLSIFTALFAYKDLLWPLIVNTSIEKMPLSSGLAMLQGQFTTNYPQLMAGAVVAIIPMAVLFLVFQKQFVEGIATTGSKN